MASTHCLDELVMNRKSDPWTGWYAAYLADRASLKALRRSAAERRRAANVVAGLLLAYMLMGGLVAAIAVTLVLTN